MSELIVQNIGTDRNPTLVVDSRLVAGTLGVQHGPWMTNILKKYQAEIEEDFGVIHFENEKLGTEGRPPSYAFLTEDQANCLMTYSKNTEQVRKAKRDLVKSFSKAKQLLLGTVEMPTPPARQLAPQRDLKDWIDCMEVMGLTEDPILKSLVSQRMAEQLGGGTPDAKPSPIVLTVQATTLGISQAEIGNGTQLGKYIIARGFMPLGKSQHGKYPVNCFEASEALNAAILNYYDRSPIEALAVVP